MAVQAEVLTLSDFSASSGVTQAHIDDAFALADFISGYQISKPTFTRIPQLRAILRLAIEYYAEGSSPQPTSMSAGPMSVGFARRAPSSVFFSTAQEAWIKGLVGTTAPQASGMYSLPMSTSLRPLRRGRRYPYVGDQPYDGIILE